MLIHHTAGNYELDATISGRVASPSAKITFSGEDPAAQAYLTLDNTGFKVIRESHGERTILKDCPGIGAPPWRIRVLKKGTSFGAGYQRRAVRQHLDRLAADGGQRRHRLRILHR